MWHICCQRVIAAALKRRTGVMIAAADISSAFGLTVAVTPPEGVVIVDA